MSGHLELTVKFSQRPTPVQVQAGMKIGIKTDGARVVTTLPLRAWKKLPQASNSHPPWVVSMTGKLAAKTGSNVSGVAVLEESAVQVFANKAKPAAGS